MLGSRPRRLRGATTHSIATFLDSRSGNSVTPSLQDSPPDFIDTLMRQLNPDTFPYLVEHAAVHMKTPEGEEESEFEFGLDLILDGLEQIRATRHGTGLDWKRTNPGSRRDPTVPVACDLAHNYVLLMAWLGHG